MKISTSLKGVIGLVALFAAILGTTYATSLVVPKTTICVKIATNDNYAIRSLQIKPYYDNKVLSSDIWSSSEDNTCVTVARDWLIGAAQPGTSFYVLGRDRAGRDHLLESRDIAMFRNIATTKRIDLSYEIMVLRSVKSIKNVSSVVAAVSAESYTSDSNVKTERVQKEIYRSLLADTAALNTMRQIEATQYTTVKDFKGKNNISREQAAKFFLNALLKRQEVTKKEIVAPSTVNCTFSDQKYIDPTLLESVTTACEFGLMKGSQGRFFPANNITLGEAVTILMRIQYGNMLETNTPWYRNYFERAFEAGIFGNLAYNPRFTDGDLPATRNMIALLIRKFLEINQIPLQNSF